MNDDHFNHMINQISLDLGVSKSDFTIFDSSNDHKFSRHVVSKSFHCESQKMIKQYI